MAASTSRRLAKMRQLTCLVGLLASAGCGGGVDGRHAISGLVQMNGAAVAEGNISFQPVGAGALSGGAVISQGRYAIPADGGLPAGKYRVSISAPAPGTGGTAVEGAMPGDPLPAPRELIPADWNVNSEHYIEVHAAGPFEFNFDVTSSQS